MTATSTGTSASYDLGEKKITSDCMSKNNKRKPETNCDGCVYKHDLTLNMLKVILF